MKGKKKSVKAAVNDYLKKIDTISNKISRVVKNIQEVFNKEDGNRRRIIEESADEINPIYGRVIKTINNIQDTYGNAKDSFTNGIQRVFTVSEVKSFNEGDHLFTQRFAFTHHGVYVGNDEVIHYLLRKGIVKTSVEVFAEGMEVFVKDEADSPISYTREEVVERANKRLGERSYNLIFNNCENFVRWCRNGTM